MTSRVDSVGLSGISGYPVMVECSISSGLPGFELVGLPDEIVEQVGHVERDALWLLLLGLPPCASRASECALPSKTAVSAFRSAASR